MCVVPTKLQEAQRRYRNALGVVAMTKVNIEHMMAKYNPGYTVNLFNLEFSIAKAAIEKEWALAQAAYPAMSRQETKRRSRAKIRAANDIQYQMSINGGGLS